MAISKSAKIQAEIEKVTAKINEQQARLKELEQKKLEAENSEIVEIVRGMSVSLTDLPALLQTIKNGGALGQNGAVDKVSLRSALPIKKTPTGVIRRILSSVSGSMRSQTRGSGPPLPLSLVAKRALSCARASARKTSPRTRPGAASAPPGIPGWNGAPGCAAGLPRSS